VLDAPSVDALHARLRLENDRRFHLYDLGSVAGTWVNYAPISRSGVLLEENDVIHFGKLAYRFVSQPSNTEPKPRVEEYKEPL
jgi:pSer/pThr/pTyr-binding forkhead associated (FHA) protein